MGRTLSFVVGASAIVAALAAAPSSPSIRAADHGDAPLVRSNQQLDINDVYVFAAPGDPTRTVMIMTVCPLSGIVTPTTFATRSDYTFRVDLDGDAVEEATWAFTFANPAADGVQKMTMKQKTGRKTTVSRGSTGTTLDLSNGTKVLAGRFDDPFFFDLLNFRAGLTFSEETASNFFRGLNTLAIVLEVPNSAFGDATAIGVWATTGKGRKQIDRMGRPAINTVLVGSADKDKFNASRPKDDLAKFGPGAKTIITALRGGDDTGVDALVAVLFPDVNTFALADTDGFLNGRQLADDVIDAELQLLTGNQAATDFVGNDSTFLTVFPYLAAPNP